MGKMMPSCGNIFTGIPDQLTDERTETLVRGQKMRIERIISRGHSSAPGFWYDQQEDEWVMLLKGAAHIQFADRKAAVSLTPGDYLHIPAHARHRVAWTDPDHDTIWLAVFFLE